MFAFFTVTDFTLKIAQKSENGREKIEPNPKKIWGENTVTNAKFSIFWSFSESSSIFGH